MISERNSESITKVPEVSLTLIGYSDADWAEDSDDRHLTTGNVFLAAGRAITWLSKKQSIVALSTAEAEYVALSSATQETVWFTQLLTELRSLPNGPIPLMEDNQGAIAIARNPCKNKTHRHLLSLHP